MSRRDKKRKHARPAASRYHRSFNEGGWIGAFVGLVLGTIAVPMLAHYGGQVGRVALFGIGFGLAGLALATLPFPAPGGKRDNLSPQQVRLIRLGGAVVGFLLGGLVGFFVPELDGTFWYQASVMGTFAGGVLGYLVGSLAPARQR